MRRRLTPVRPLLPLAPALLPLLARLARLTPGLLSRLAPLLLLRRIPQRRGRWGRRRRGQPTRLALLGEDVGDVVERPRDHADEQRPEQRPRPEAGDVEP